MARVQDIVDYLQETAPFQYQESYDNSGLLVGNPNWEVTGVLVALDCIESIVDEAIDQGANVIVTHHPIIFKGLKRLTGSNYIERTVIKAIEHKIALIAIHTNLDNYRFGVNHIIANKLGLVKQQILAPKEAVLFGLTVFVPVENASELRIALASAGAGQIGDYDSCSFSVEGEGRFKPLEGSNPVIGHHHDLTNVKEERISVIVEKHLLSKVVKAMKTAHPYEEVAHEIIPLSNKHVYLGSGMIGELEQPMESMDFLRLIKERFRCENIRYTSICKNRIERVALCGGSGSFLLTDAKQQNADIFITADFKYHEFFDAEEQIIIADIGHFESEQYTSEWLVWHLTKKFTTFAVRLTNVSTNPINYL
jgi:dinuclear metal center YbgI/SA1388 family protein